MVTSQLGEDDRSPDALDTALGQRVSEVRAGQGALLRHLLDFLPRVTGLDPARIQQIRDIQTHGDHPYLLMFVGTFSAGKSSLINALIGEPLLKTGPTPTTDRIRILRYGDEPLQLESGRSLETVYHPSDLLRTVSLVDTPGLESIFSHHEAMTREYLHRADAVFFVMLASQAMSSQNLDALQTLRDFGKKLAIVINQIDLLTVEETAEVQAYVAEQSQLRLGLTPPVWPASAREGQAAWEDGERDEVLWRASGLDAIEAYIRKELSDMERVRGKLLTPLYLAQSVLQQAEEQLTVSQASLDGYRATVTNIDRQIQAQLGEQRGRSAATQAAITAAFDQSADCSRDALIGLFRLSQGLRALGTGIAEALKLGGLFKTRSAQAKIQQAYLEGQCFEPLAGLQALVQAYSAVIESKDMHDVDQLVQHSQRALTEMPVELRGHLIGELQAPVAYDRSAMEEVMPDLNQIVHEATTVDTAPILEAFRDTSVMLLVWELICGGLAILMIVLALNNPDSALPPLLFLGIASLALLGFLLPPLRGRAIGNRQAGALQAAGERYRAAYGAAVAEQAAYGASIRRDAVSPLTRLISAQIEESETNAKAIAQARRDISRIEQQISSLGRRQTLKVR
jgi:GTP-binding protein EngB required for normal cell division